MLMTWLLYADDLALLASSQEELQQMLDALSAFCSRYDMEVNVSKTEVVVFGRQRYVGPAHVTFMGRDGVRLPQQQPSLMGPISYDSYAAGQSCLMHRMLPAEQCTQSC
jgi:hypothetical protein